MSKKIQTASLNSEFAGSYILKSVSDSQGSKDVLYQQNSFQIIYFYTGFLTSKIPQKHLRKGIELFLFGSAQWLLFLLNILAPHGSNFAELSVFMVFYGIANGLNSSWCFPVLSRLVPVIHLRQAIGMFHFFCGIGFITGPPLAGRR